MKLVRVDWRDASGDGEWVKTDEFYSWAESPLATCTHFGLLQEDTEGTYIIIQGVNDHGQVSGRLAIPKECVMAITEIQETDVVL